MTTTVGPLPRYFPHWSDRLGARLLDPWMRRLAPALPGFAVIDHVGRKSGTQYQTPVSIFRRGEVMAVVLLHGETNWARNVVSAGQARIHYRGSTLTARKPRILHPRHAPADTPRIARLGNRIAGILVVEVDRSGQPGEGGRVGL